MNAPLIAGAPNQLVWQQRDWRNLLLIGAGYAIALWLMPIQHDFAIIDDWIYSDAVGKILNGAGFVPPQLSQVTLVSHAYWGALLSALLGFNFTTLTLATMVMSLVAALTFYLLLRRLGFSSGLSGLGVAILAFNPQYLSLSYSYMTDITFLALLLLSSLLYLEGINSGVDGWLWLGSAITALGFLTRQFGLAPAVGNLLFLLYTRRLTVKRLLASSLLPTITAIGYFLWRSGYPSALADTVQSGILSDLLHDPIGLLLQQTILLLFWLPFLGLTVPLWGPLRRKWLLIPWLALIGITVYRFRQVTATPPDTSVIMAQPQFTQPFRLEQTPLWWLGVGLTALLLASFSERAWPWLVAHWQQRQATTRDFLYILGAILFVGIFLFGWVGFEPRYQLSIIPLCIIVALVPLQSYSWPRLVPIIAALVLLAGYSIAQHIDEYDFYRVRWQAGEQLAAQGVAYDTIDNGSAWDSYHYSAEEIKRANTSDFYIFVAKIPQVIDRQYLITIQQEPGYKVIQQIPYFSILDGFTTHYLMLQEREP